jgi:NAD(P)-dependent dehydrogenase (short-subunit alcohol dehydrogenase family)
MKFLPKFKEQRHGKIINISGGGAAYPRPYFSAYATSKAGVVRFTETIAEELKEYSIDCNCIAPGALNTRMLSEVLNAGIKSVGYNYYERAMTQKLSGGDSLKDAAELCTYLASDKSDGLTGKLISARWDKWRDDIPEHIEEIKNSDIYTLRRILPKDRNKNWGDVE